MSKKNNRSAFALILVLLVLVVAATALAATARNSCRRAMRSGSMQRDLQLRWGTLSCQAACLTTAELMLAEEEAARTKSNGDSQDSDNYQYKPVRTLRRQIALGNMTFHLIISDEQAKANANALHGRCGRAVLSERLRSLQFGQRRVLVPRLKPMKPAGSAAQSIQLATYPVLYNSFDQLFAVDHPSRLAQITDSLTDGSVADKVTCWGDGKVNFRRADRRVLRVMLEGVVDETQLDKLIKLRSSRRDCTLFEAIEAMELTEKESAEVMPLLTDMSWCHSLWIIAQGSDRSWYSLHIKDASATSGSSEVAMEW